MGRWTTLVSAVLALGFSIALVVTLVPGGSPDAEAALKWQEDPNTDLSDEAEQLYGVDQVVVYPVDGSRFGEVFTGHDLFLVYDLTQHPSPAYTMAVPDEGDARDVTQDYNAILSDEDVLIETSDQALAYGEALAQAANADLLPVEERELVDASDSERLNHPIEDPQVETVNGQWKVEVTTYSPDNGVIADWTIYLDLTVLKGAEFLVDAVAKGPHEATWTTTPLKSGHYVVNDYTDGSYELSIRDTDEGQDLRLLDDLDENWNVTAETDAFDGSTWQAQRHADDDWSSEDQQLATNLTDAGAWSHDWLVERADCGDGTTNPGPLFRFDQPDPDCTYEIRILPDDVFHTAAVFDRSQAPELVTYVHPDLRDWLANDLGWDEAGLPTDGTSVSRLVLGHLHETFLGTHDDVSQLPAADGPAEPADGPSADLQDAVDRRALVGYVNGTLPDGDPGYVQDHNATVLHRTPALQLLAIEVDPANRSDLLADAREERNVSYAVNETIVEPQHDSTHEPSDPLQNGTAAIDLPEAWAHQLGSHAADVHLHDTGVDLTHLDLFENTSPACDPPSLGKSFGTVDTPDGLESGQHGTAMAGIAGAVLDNAKDRAGASGSCLTPVRVMGPTGGTAGDAARGLVWSTDQGADVISVGYGTASVPALRKAIEYAHAHGVLVVAPAGNTDCGPVTYPAAYPETLAVASLEPGGGSRSSFSACGSAIDAAAVGEDITSTAPANTLRSVTGTSAAAAFVSGTAGLLFAENPDLTSYQARCLLEATAEDIGLPASEVGEGIANANTSVHAAAAPASQECALSPLASTDGYVRTDEGTAPIEAMSDVQTTYVYTDGNATVIDTATDQIRIGPRQAQGATGVVNHGTVNHLVNYATPGYVAEGELNAIGKGPTVGTADTCDGQVLFETHYAEWAGEAGFENAATYLTLEWRTDDNRDDPDSEAWATWVTESWEDPEADHEHHTFLQSDYDWSDYWLWGDELYLWLNRTAAMDLQTAKDHHGDEDASADGVHARTDETMELIIDGACY